MKHESILILDYFLSEVLQKLFSKLQIASDESLLTLTLNGRPHIQLIEAIVNTCLGGESWSHSG